MADDDLLQPIIRQNSRLTPAASKESRRLGRIVTGDQFLTAMKRFVQSNVENMENGQLHLTLNSSCIKYLNEKLHEVHEAIYGSNIEAGSRSSLELKKRGMDKNFFDDELLELHDGITNLMCLRIEPRVKGNWETRGDIDLKMFRGLKWIEFKNVKPTLVVNMFEISQQVEAVIVRGVLNSIAELLDFDADSKHPWKYLREICCAHNNIPSIDDSMSLLPNVKRVDLSHNLISQIQNLSNCFNIDYLNIGFNRITSVENINSLVGNIKTLILRGNAISETAGLERMYSLQVLDLAENVVSSFDEIKRISHLPELTDIWFQGNPISSVATYRNKVLQAFVATLSSMTLDGRKVREQERQEILEENTQNLRIETLLARDLRDIAVEIPSHSSSASSHHSHSPSDSSPSSSSSASSNSSSSLLPATSPKAKSASKKLKKAPTKRVIEPTTMKPGGDDQQGSAESESYRSYVEGLKKQNGSSWLLILNREKAEGIAPPTPPIPQAPEKKPKKSTKKSKSTSVELPQAAGQELSSASGTTPVQEVAPPPPPPKLPKQISIKGLLGEEFFVGKKNDRTGGFDDRILILSENSLTEHDASTGVDIVDYPLKHAYSLADLSSGEDGKPVVRLVFKISGKEEAYVYRLESEEARKKITKLIRDILLSRGVKCMTCQAQFAGELNLSACPSCKGSFLVEYNLRDEVSQPEEGGVASTSQKQEDKEKQETITPAPSPLVVKDPSGLDQTTIFLFRSSYFQFGEQEQFLFFLRSDVIWLHSKPPAPTRAEQCSVELILTNICLYIKKANSEELLAKHAVSEFKKVVFGLFYQFFWTEVNENCCYVFTTRDHVGTHQFLTILQNTVKASSLGWIVNYNRETIRALSAQLFESGSLVIHLYLLVFQKTKQTVTGPYSWQSNGSNLRSRTIVVTHEQVLLIDEDVLRSPGLHFFTRPTSPAQFQLIDHQSISDVFAVELDPKDETAVSLLFEKEGQSVDQQEPIRWELKTAGVAERKKLVATLGKLWKELFKLDLALMEKGGNV